MKKIYLLLAIFFAANPLFAQNDPDTPTVTQDNQDAIERVMQDGNTDGGELLDNTAFEALDNLSKHKIDVNKADEADFKLLTETLLLTDFQVQSLFAYRKKYGELLALEELQAVPSWDLDAIRRVLPFLKVAGGVDDFHVSLKDLFIKGSNEFYLRSGRFIEKTKGYQSDPATGTRGGFLRHRLPPPFRRHAEEGTGRQNLGRHQQARRQHRGRRRLRQRDHRTPLRAECDHQVAQVAR